MELLFSSQGFLLFGSLVMSDTELHSGMAHENTTALERDHVADPNDPDKKAENNSDLHSSMAQETNKDTDEAPSDHRAKVSLAQILEMFLSAADSETGHKHNYFFHCTKHFLEQMLLVEILKLLIFLRLLLK